MDSAAPSRHTSKIVRLHSIPKRGVQFMMRMERIRYSCLLSIVFLILWLCGSTPALQEVYQKGHDGSTVSRMLARIGEGSAHFGVCRNEECEVRHDRLDYITPHT